jgi:hypothetical protein
LQLVSPAIDHASVKALLASLDPNEKAKLDRLMANELKRLWHPTPGPQLDAYLSEADVMLYGGAAGGGKTDLAIGLCLNEHLRCLVIRRQIADLQGFEERLFELVGTDGYNSNKHRWKSPANPNHIVELGGLKDPGSEKVWQGRPHDLIIFDEAAQLQEARVSFVMGWLRSASNVAGAPGRRCRVVLATNPPSGGDGLWLLEWFKPWLDPLFPNKAKPGELRWCIMVAGKTVWVNGPGVHSVEGQNYTATSRTFIPAKLDDNPYLRDTNYRAQVESLPEPLRTQLLTGDFSLARIDSKNQVVPSAYIRAAQARWREDGNIKNPMTAMALDVAFGGKDTAILAAVHDQWFAPIDEKPGVQIEHTDDLSGMVFARRKNKAPVAVDMGGGYGISVAEKLHDSEIRVFRFNGSKKTEARQAQGGLKFKNLRAKAYWEFREDLSPSSEFRIALPPDTRLGAEFAAIEGFTRAGVYQVESKDDIRAKLGTSTDKADAIVMAWWVRKQLLRSVSVKKQGNANDHAATESPWAGL